MKTFEIPSFNLTEEVVETTPQEVSNVTEVVEKSASNDLNLVVEEDETPALDTKVVPEADQLLKTTFDYYKESGFFEGLADYKEPKTPDELLSLLDKRASTQMDNLLLQADQAYLSQFPEWLQPVFKAVKEGSVPLAKEEFLNLLNDASPSNYKETDFDDLNKAETYYKQFLIEQQGFSEDVAKDTIDTLKDNGTLSAITKKAFKLEEGGKKTRVENFVENTTATAQANKEYLEQFHNKVITTTPTLGFRPDLQNTIVDSFKSGQFKQRMESWFENPEGLPYLIALSQLWDGKKFHMDKIQAMINSKAVSNKRDKLRGAIGGAPSANTNRTATDDDLDNFDIII